MVTNGDVYAVVAILAGICVSGWALILGVALLFPHRAQIARGQIGQAPWRAFLVGLAMLAVLGTFSFILLAQPLPLGKLVGWTMMLGLLSIAATGAAGVATLASERLRALAPEMTPYTALSKSALVVVISGLVPLLGWFLIVPMLIIFSLGTGVQALLTRTASQARFQV